MQINSYINNIMIQRNKFYEGNPYIIIIIYFVFFFILDYSGIINLYDQNFVRRMFNFYRRRDNLTYMKKLKPFCMPFKNILNFDDIQKLQSINIPNNKDLPWFSRKYTTTHQCCTKFNENERNIINEISEKVRLKYEEKIGKKLYYLSNNKATIYVYHGKYSQHLWHVDPRNDSQIYNIIICFKKRGEISPLQCKDLNDNIDSIYFEEGDAAIFNGGTTVHQVPPNSDENSERTVLSIAFTSSEEISKCMNCSDNLCTYIEGGNNYYNASKLILATFIINYIIGFIAGVDFLPYNILLVFITIVLVIAKYFPLYIDINLGTGRSSSLIHNFVLILFSIITTCSIKRGILFFSYFALSYVFFSSSWVAYD